MSGLGLKKLAVNAAATLGRQIGSGLIQLVTLAIIARQFGAEGNGAYALALLLPSMLAMFLNLGIGPANVYYLGSRQVSPKQAWQVTLKLSLLISLLGLAIGALSIIFYAESWFSGVPPQMLWLALSFFPLIFIYTAIGNILQGLQEFKQFNAILIVQPIVNLALVLAAIFFGFIDIFYILICYLMSVVLNFLLALRLLNKVLKVKTGPQKENYTKHLMSYGYKAHLSNILAFVNNRADMLLLSYFIGPAAVGVYTVVIGLTEKLWLLSSAISTVLVPRLSELSSDEEKRNLLTPLIARWVLWVTFAGAVFLALVSNLFLQLVFGEEFIVGHNVILWLLPGVVLGACSMVLANDMAARGRPDLNLATTWISVSINVIGNIILIPRFGIEGAAAATSFAYVINMMMRLTMHSHFTGVKFYKNLIITKEDFILLKKLITKSPL